MRAGKPITFPRTEKPSPALAANVTDRIWPNIELQWEWLCGLPPLRKAAVIGAGSWGTAVAVLLARGGLEVSLGTRTEEKADLTSVFQTARALGFEFPRAVAQVLKVMLQSPAFLYHWEIGPTQPAADRPMDG